MKTNVCLFATLRKPFSSLLLLILFGLITFGFVTKAVGYILVQRETGVLGSYYRSIGVLENVKDPQSGDVSAGIDLIETSPYLAYGDQREIVSGVMSGIYNKNHYACNCPFWEPYPKERWPNVHNTDIWFTGALIQKEEAKPGAKPDKNTKTIGYYLRFDVDTLLAGYPEEAQQGQKVGLIFTFDGHEDAIPTIQAMEVGQRYFIHGWDNGGYLDTDYFFYGTNLQIIPLDGGGLWYLPLAQDAGSKDAGIDFSTPAMAAIQNAIEVENENLHTLNILATADMSAMPHVQEASRWYYLTAGRWLNHRDDQKKAKVIVVPEDFASLRGLKLGDEITLTFRPLTDTYYGNIRDGVDSTSWRSYPTYQDTFQIVGIYQATFASAVYAYIPTASLRPGFTSSMQDQFRYENDYSFVLDSSRHETQFTQAYQDRLQVLGINLTFLPDNGPAYWAAVEPIRRSAAADALVFGLLLVVALSMAVFLYILAHKRNYAILRALGVPIRQANSQLVLPLLLLGGLGILGGGLPSWNYALSQAKATLSTLPTPAGVAPSDSLSPLVLAGLCGAIFLFLGAVSWLGVFLLSHRPVFELLQGQAARPTGRPKQTGLFGLRLPSIPTRPTEPVGQAGSPSQAHAASLVISTQQRKYSPASLSRYVILHGLRSGLKSSMTLAVALGFLLASAWIRQTMQRSRLQIDHLYDTTVVTADILSDDPTKLTPLGTVSNGTGFIYQKTIEGVLASGFAISSSLEADVIWPEIGKLDSSKSSAEYLPVYAYDSPEAFYAGLADPGSLSFAAGWDMERFTISQTMEEIQQDGVPTLFPANLLAQLQLEVGEKVRITDPFVHIFPCLIVGQYSGGRSFAVHGGKIPWLYSPSDSILVSLSAMQSIEGSQIKYTVAHFTLDPMKNRELPQFQAEIVKALQAPGMGLGDMRFKIWDEELKIVTGQLDKNLTLLAVLYPVVMAVSVLIGAGLCFLLLLQVTREAAILRVLGVTRRAVRLALIVEPLILSVLGVAIGLGISRLVWMSAGLVSVGTLLVGASLYLAGALAGLVTSAILVTSKKPIELLQVKE
jgi:ABC-type antimicrobial peptide transport system permease subunit